MVIGNSTGTREQILEASLELFAAKGFHGASMRDIAQAVGIRKSSIYNHFSSKNKLLETLMSNLGPGSIDHVIKNIDFEEIQEPYQTLKKFGEIFYQIMTKPEEQKFMRLMIKEHNNIIVRKALKDGLYNHTRLIFADLFRQMIDRALIKKGNPVVYANEFISSLVFFRLIDLLVLYDDEEFEDLKEYIDGHIEFFWEAVKPIQ